MTHNSKLFEVSLNNYSGSLDLLLDLAKAQKVNLEDISITKLADQFHQFITKSKDLNLEVASEYLLTATWLAYLKSKLLLPETDEEDIKIISNILGVKVEPATINGGLPYLSSGMLVNNKSMVVGSLTNGSEIMMLTRAFTN